jgi:hypothetical protein
MQLKRAGEAGSFFVEWTLSRFSVKTFPADSFSTEINRRALQDGETPVGCKPAAPNASVLLFGDKILL